MSWYIEEQLPIYADYNATTPLAPEVEEKIVAGLKLWSNPSSSYAIADEPRKAIAEARSNLATLLHVKPDDVIFTSGGTEANNWVISASVNEFKEKYPGRKPQVICSIIEHPAIIEPLVALEKRGEIDVYQAVVDPETGIVSTEDIAKHISENTCLVTLMLANNETGVIQPVREVGGIVYDAGKKQGRKIFYHSDVAQALGKLDVNLDNLRVDAVTVVGHKLYGPRIGALVLRNSLTTEISPMIFGGGQERNLRPGTENTPMIMGLGAAAKVASDRLEEIETHLREIRDYFEERLKDALGDGVHFNFQSSPRLPNTSSAVFPKYSTNSCDLLDKCKSFYASTGAACHTGEVSKILTACGLSFDQASKTVRFSFGRETTKEEIDRIVKELKAMVFFSKFGSSLMGALGKGPVPGF